MEEAGRFFCRGLPAEFLPAENLINLESDEPDAPGNVEFDDFTPDKGNPNVTRIENRK